MIRCWSIHSVVLYVIFVLQCVVAPCDVDYLTASATTRCVRCESLEVHPCLDSVLDCMLSFIFVKQAYFHQARVLHVTEQLEAALPAYQEALRTCPHLVPARFVRFFQKSTTASDTTASDTTASDTALQPSTVIRYPDTTCDLPL